MSRIARFLAREDGPTSVEYAIMVTLMVVICATSITVKGRGTGRTFAGSGSSSKTGDRTHLAPRDADSSRGAR